MDSGPLTSLPVHDHLRTALRELYTSHAIFDKFEVSVSPLPSRVVTGSYGGTFKVLDYTSSFEYSFRAGQRPPFSHDPEHFAFGDEVDVGAKVLRAAWHPRRMDLVSVACDSMLHLHRI